MTNILVPKLFGFAKTNVFFNVFVCLFFCILPSPFSVGGTLYVAYKQYKIKRKVQTGKLHTHAEMQ